MKVIRGAVFALGGYVLFMALRETPAMRRYLRVARM
jgi:hypothetical protein